MVCVYIHTYLFVYIYICVCVRITPEGPGIDFFQSWGRFNPDWNGFVIDFFNNIIEKKHQYRFQLLKKTIIIEKQ